MDIPSLFYPALIFPDSSSATTFYISAQLSIQPPSVFSSACGSPPFLCSAFLAADVSPGIAVECKKVKDRWVNIQLFILKKYYWASIALFTCSRFICSQFWIFSSTTIFFSFCSLSSCSFFSFSICSWIEEYRMLTKTRGYSLYK